MPRMLVKSPHVDLGYFHRMSGPFVAVQNSFGRNCLLIEDHLCLQAEDRIHQPHLYCIDLVPGNHRHSNLL